MNPPTAPTPRPAHAFARTLTRSERAIVFMYLLYGVAIQKILNLEICYPPSDMIIRLSPSLQIFSNQTLFSLSLYITNATNKSKYNPRSAKAIRDLMRVQLLPS
ncbi:hypothetical protein ACN38_g6346 [Penicillium nordicum]|uniref:Uncharacterized protein n=1 Tax=Penicillium nordicum TaxID=229535 RepID=A0A0M8P8A8_9EURO|nr:hypothetical protein ACN38_g6346 [Penicillium nordicum]